MLLLVDGRQGLKPADREMISFLERHNVAWQIIVTKSDKVPAKQLAKRITIMKVPPYMLLVNLSRCMLYDICVLAQAAMAKGKGKPKGPKVAKATSPKEKVVAMAEKDGKDDHRSGDTKAELPLEEEPAEPRDSQGDAATGKKKHRRKKRSGGSGSGGGESGLLKQIKDEQDANPAKEVKKEEDVHALMPPTKIQTVPELQKLCAGLTSERMYQDIHMPQFGKDMFVSGRAHHGHFWVKSEVPPGAATSFLILALQNHGLTTVAQKVIGFTEGHIHAGIWKACKKALGQHGS